MSDIQIGQIDRESRINAGGISNKTLSELMDGEEEKDSIHVYDEELQSDKFTARPLSVF